jgi:hypothetical protein
VTLLRVALTKIPPVTAVVPAVKVAVLPLEAPIEPSVVLVRAHTYVIPVAGQVELHVGVAVKPWLAPAATEGVTGSTASEFKVMGGVTVTVITV